MVGDQSVRTAVVQPEDASLSGSNCTGVGNAGFTNRQSVELCQCPVQEYDLLYFGVEYNQFGVLVQPVESLGVAQGAFSKGCDFFSFGGEFDDAMLTNTVYESFGVYTQEVQGQR